MDAEIGPPRYVGVEGQRIAYRDFGSGPTVVLLHGIPTWSYLWRNVVPALVSRGLGVVTIDLLGFGESDRPLTLILALRPRPRASKRFCKS